MIQWLKRLLYESVAAEFRSAYSVAESVERLRAATKRSAFSTIGETAAVGKVSPESVRLQRVMPMIHNSFKPYFVGRFESRDGLTLLTGKFGMSMFTKIFMTFWLVMVALFAIGFSAGSMYGRAAYPQPIVIGPFLMLVAGLGMVALGKWFARNDIAWLSGVIGQALGVPGVRAQTGEDTQIDPAAVPMVLKGVALFLAASGVMALFANSVQPKMRDAPAVVLQMGHWNIIYAVMAFVLAMGVWRRRPWAWWGGFVLLCTSTVTSLLAMPIDTQPELPPFMRVVFGVFAVIVVAIWGRWWYAQRRHFLWPTPPAV
jgi:hypothetical protein